MNPWTIAIPVVLLVDHAIRVLAAALNLRALGPDVPPSLRGVYDPARYGRVREYIRVRTRFGLIVSTAELAALLLFWWAGGFGWVDRLARAPGFGPVGTGLVFVAALGLGQSVLALPFAWWSTFRIEERFGFNRTTPWTFWTDRLKGLALAAALGGPLVAAVLWLFASAGAHAWLVCWAVVALAVIVLQLVVPAWILPLFNRFTPLADGALRDAILAYACRAGFSLEDVWVTDGSRRSTKANAFFTGIGRRRRVALFDTLLQTLDPAAVVGVVAHEIGHYKRGHVVQGMAITIVHAGALLLLLSWALGSERLFAAFGFDAPSVHAGLMTFGLLLAPIELPLGIALQAWSRRNEHEADRFAAETTGDGRALARGLERLAADTLAHPTPHPFYVLLNYSHPPLHDRLRALAAAG